MTSRLSPSAVATSLGDASRNRCAMNASSRPAMTNGAGVGSASSRASILVAAFRRSVLTASFITTAATPQPLSRRRIPVMLPPKMYARGGASGPHIPGRSRDPRLCVQSVAADRRRARTLALCSPTFHTDVLHYMDTTPSGPAAHNPEFLRVHPRRGRVFPGSARSTV